MNLKQFSHGRAAAGQIPPPDSREFFRQQIRKAREYLPACAGAVQAAIEPRVKHQVGFHTPRRRKQQPGRVRAQEWLDKVPDLASKLELMGQRMRDGKRLPELSAMHRIFNLLVENVIVVDVKSSQVGAEQKNR